MNYHKKKEEYKTVNELGPVSLQIEVTTECNLSCRHCPRTYGLHWKDGEKKSNTLPFFDRSLLPTLQNTAPFLRRVTLHGFGEPLLHPHFVEILKFFHGMGISIRFTTNGMLLNDEIMLELVHQEVEYVFVSLDSSDPEQFSRLRRGANLPLLLEKLRYLNAIKHSNNSDRPAIGVMYVVSRFNYDQTLRMLKLAKSIGAREILYNPFIAPSPKFRSWQWNPQNYWDWRKRITEEAHKQDIQVNFHFGSQSLALPFGEKRCRRLEDSIYMAVDGRIFPCCYHPHTDEFSLGSLYEMPLTQIWNSSPVAKLRNRLRTGDAATRICRTCPEFRS
jgi:radical SAM protein with 4Fe4S-binding SPASM domain